MSVISLGFWIATWVSGLIAIAGTARLLRHPVDAFDVVRAASVCGIATFWFISLGLNAILNAEPLHGLGVGALMATFAAGCVTFFGLRRIRARV